MGISIFAYIEAVMGTDEFEVCLIDIIEPVLVICFIHAEDPKIGKEGEKTQGWRWLLRWSLCYVPGSLLERNF